MSRTIAPITLAVTLVAAIVPLSPHDPLGGLDNSWMMAMNEAVARRLPLGRDVVFTFGPFASVYTRVFDPRIDLLSLVAGLTIALQYFVCVRRIATRRRPLALVLTGLAVLFFSYSLDAILISAALLAGLYAWLLAAEDRRSEAGLRLPGPAHVRIALVFAAFGLLTLVKVTFVSLAGPMLLLSIGVLVWRRRSDLALAALCGCVLGIAGFWLCAGQRLNGLLAYFSSSLSIISGYTDAMSLQGDPSEPLAYWGVSVLGLVAIATDRSHSRADRAWLAAVVALVLMTASKSGFTRHDEHAAIAFATLALTMLVLRMTLVTMNATVALVAAVLLTAHFDDVHVRSSTVGTLTRFGNAYEAVWTGLRERLSGNAAARARYEQALEALRRAQPYPRWSGTADIYSFGQSGLIASGNRWNPRPVFQSYSAYNPTLAEMNRAHLAERDAPDHILLRLEPIDRHPPLLEDGPSWIEFLSRYRPIATDGDLAYLEHRVSPAVVTRAVPKRMQGRFGEPVPLANTAPIDFVRLDVRRTLLGQLVSFLFRIEPPCITVGVADGGNREYRLVPGMALSGFIASPLVENIFEAVELYTVHTPRSKAVTTLTIHLPADASTWDRLMWQPVFTIEDTPTTIEPENGAAAVKRLDRIDGVSKTEVATTADCVGRIDTVNNSPDLAHPVADRLLKVDGWLDQGSPAVKARDVLITLTDPEGRMRYVPTHATRRTDVATTLGRRELEDSGFVGSTDLRDSLGQWTIGLAYRSDGRLVKCRQVTIPLTVRH